MSDTTDPQTRIALASLSANRTRRFTLVPPSEVCATMADTLSVQAVRKLRFEGALEPEGRNSWRLEAKLGATVVQTCVVTLEPVTTRIDTTVVRRYLPDAQLEDIPEGAEVEIPEDDSIEALPEVLDLDDVMTEALSLALPPYPRKDDAALGEAVYAEDGVEPIRDEDLRPFAGLAALRDKLGGTGGKS